MIDESHHIAYLHGRVEPYEDFDFAEIDRRLLAAEGQKQASKPGEASEPFTLDTLKAIQARAKRRRPAPR